MNISSINKNSNKENIDFLFRESIVNYLQTFRDTLVNMNNVNYAMHSIFYSSLEIVKGFEREFKTSFDYMNSCYMVNNSKIYFGNTAIDDIDQIIKIFQTVKYESPPKVESADTNNTSINIKEKKEEKIRKIPRFESKKTISLERMNKLDFSVLPNRKIGKNKFFIFR